MFWILYANNILFKLNWIKHHNYNTRRLFNTRFNPHHHIFQLYFLFRLFPFYFMPFRLASVSSFSPDPSRALQLRRSVAMRWSYDKCHSKSWKHWNYLCLVLLCDTQKLSKQIIHFKNSTRIIGAFLASQGIGNAISCYPGG